MKAKTFVTDDYQVTLMKDGGIMVLFEEEAANTSIIYHEDYRDPWWLRGPHCCKEAESLGELGLSKSLLKKLYEALLLVDKQDLMDNEIAFVKEKKVNKKEEPEDKVKEVSNKNFDQVKSFKGWTEEEVYSKVNNYAKLQNLRIISCPEPKYQDLPSYTTTAVFDRW